MERRFSGRSGLQDETTILTKDGIFAGTLENISMGGIFLRTDQPLRIGDVIEITIPLPEHFGESKIVVDGIAIRIVGNGVALKFLNFDEDTERALLYLTASGQA